jgi:hypothetical protein
MATRSSGLFLFLAALAALLPGPASGQDAGGGAAGGGPPPGPAPAPPAGDPPPAQDLRFFPKELEDALKDLTNPEGDDETRYDALQKISRMRGLTGAEEPLKKDAFEPILKAAFETHLDSLADVAGMFLSALDRDRLVKEVRKVASNESDPSRLRNLTYLAENIGAPEGTKLLTGPLAEVSVRDVRLRVVEALGLLRAKEGVALASGLMRDPDLSVANVGALALGRIGDPGTVPLLLAGLGESKEQHGWFCADALGRIEDPGIFDAVLARPSAGGGGGIRAKAIEVCARAANVAELVSLLQKGATQDVRAAAANALGRIVGEEKGSAESLASPELRESIADGLLESMVSDKEPTVRAACFWSLRKCATDKTGGKALKRLTTVQGEDKVLFLLTVLGELKVQESAVTILRSGILGADQPMIRRASGVSFWQIGNAEAEAEFKEKCLAAQDAGTIQRFCEALGSRRSKDGFDLALQMLRSTRTGSREQYDVLLCLEKMTGHYFGPFPGIWEKWFKKNPQFFSHKQSRLEREKWKADFDKENKGFRHTKDTEKAVQMGLGWLARHQGHDGVYDGVKFFNRCDPKNPCSRQGGARTQISQAGYTGIACMCFTGAGYSPDSGKFRHALLRGLDSLVATVSVDGDFDQADLLWNRSYSRPIAMQALAEGYSMCGNERYRRAAERILAREFSLMNQNGGWRYSLKREVPELDSSVTAWVVFAIKASEKAGIEVPRLLWEGPYMAFDKLSQRVPQAGPYEEFIEEAGDYGTDVAEGKKEYVFITGYQDASGGPGRATTPLGVMSRIFLGWRRTHPFCIGGANFIVKTYLTEFNVFGEPGQEDWSKAGRFTPKAIWCMYNIYYCTLTMHQMGGKYFYDWNRRVSRVLPFFQNKNGCERGSWPSKWGTADDNEGWVYTTAMGVLTLETYYRYAPILAD